MSDNFEPPNGGDSFTTVSSESWLSRLMGAFVGILIGLLLIPGAIWLIAWNEGRAVDTARALAEGSGAVIEVSPDRVNPANQGRLVHLMGPLNVPGTLSDPAYGVSAPGAAKLIRHVEMFQWQQTESAETHNRVGGGTETATTDRYALAWADRPVDSTKFRQPNGHSNPPFRVRSGTKVAAQGYIGAFKLDSTVLGKLGPQEPLAPQMPPPTGQLLDGGIYLGADSQSPALGDIRIHYFVVHPQAASVVAQQDGETLRPYTASNGHALLMVDSGEVAAPAMFNEAKQENALIAWLLRAGGSAAMLLGFYLLLRPLAVFAALLPVLGDIVAAGAGIVALLLTVILAPLVIAVAWLAVRPLVGGAVLAGGVVAAVLTARQIRLRRAAAAPGGFLPIRTP